MRHKNIMVPDMETSQDIIVQLDKRLKKILEKAIVELRDNIIKELFKEIVQILKETAINMHKLTERVDQLTVRLDELTQRVNQLTVQVSRIVGEMGAIKGKIYEWEIVDGLKGVFKRFGLDVFASPWRLFDAYIIGDGFLAIMEICVRCRKDDVDQIKRVVGIAIDKLGMRPDALAVFSLECPSEDIVEYGANMGVVVENSPIRLARKLNEIIKRKTGA